MGRVGSRGKLVEGVAAVRTDESMRGNTTTGGSSLMNSSSSAALQERKREANRGGLSSVSKGSSGLSHGSGQAVPVSSNHIAKYLKK